MNANKFKTINQSFEQQVNNNLSDMDRLIKRTKLNRRNVTPIGYTTKEEDDHENGNKTNLSTRTTTIFPKILLFVRKPKAWKMIIYLMTKISIEYC